MDADRFDNLAKRFVAPATRRATLGGAAAGLLGALGLRPAAALPAAALPAAQPGSCTLAFVAAVRLGPSSGQPLTAGGQRPGELRGELRFSLAASGSLEDGTLSLASGEAFPVVGQATGNVLNARIAVAPRVAMVVVGVGEQEIAACQGAIDGMVTGPEVGDLGDWHAAALASGGQANAPTERAPKSGRNAAKDRAGGGQDQGGSENAAQGGGGARTKADRAGRGQGQGQSQGQAQGQSQGQSGGQSGGGGQQGGGRGGRAASASTDAPSCPPGETYCDYVAECRNLSTSPLDCGACDNGCPSIVCQDGRCLSEEEADRLIQVCDDVYTFCDLEEGYCADLLLDSLNCGACGNVCAGATPYCSGGTCFEGRDGEDEQNATGCGALQILCNGACIDPATDGDNCGSCGNVCQTFPEIYNCESGVCVEPSCDPLTKCGFLCVDPLIDPLHCGACGVACLERTTCQNGACTAAGGGGCLSGLVDCGGTCVDQGSDSTNCGGCGNICAEGTYCSVGACVASGGGGCRTGLTGCGGVCVDLSTDPANCGGCGVICGEGTTCGFGVCIAAGGGGCPVDLFDCGGVCVDLRNDPANCGACGLACDSGTCAVGQCAQ